QRRIGRGAAPGCPQRKVRLAVAAVVAIAVGLEIARESVQAGAVAEGVERAGERARIPAAVASLDARRVAGAGGVTGDDVHHAGRRAVAVLHRSAPAQDLDALDRLERNGGPLNSRLVDVVQPPAIDEDERVL